MDVFSLISLFGGLALFLYGIEVMGDGLKKVSGGALKKVLGKLTSNVVFGVLTGAAVTAIIQSSTATIVLTVGLLSAEILTLTQAASIVMGANIGTTVTAQIIRLADLDASSLPIMKIFQTSTLAPVALIIGIILIMFIKKSKAKRMGDIFLGFGVLFIGLMNMTAAVEPLKESAFFMDLMEKFAQYPIISFAIGLAFTFIVQSSSAAVGMFQALASTGAITFTLTYPFIMGSNIGTCVTTAIVCSIGASKDAKRVGVIHILFNVIGTVAFAVVFLIIKAAGGLPDLWGMTADAGTIANFQTIFNLVTAIALLPFAGLLVKASKKIVKEKTDADYIEFKALDEKLFVSPVMAIQEVGKGIADMAKICQANLVKSFSLLTKYDERVVEQMNEAETKIDAYTDAATNYMIKLSKYVESSTESTEINMLLQSVEAFERMADYAMDIEEIARQIKEDNVKFSDDAMKELELICRATEDITATTVDIYRDRDIAGAFYIEPFEEVTDDMIAVLKDRHLQRLKSGECHVTSGLLFVQLLTYLERSSDQCSNVGLLLLGLENKAILQNHHEYLRELHHGDNVEYSNEFKKRKEQYFTPLLAIGQNAIAQNN